MFAALQEYFESGSRSANAEKNETRRLSENKNRRSNYDELFAWAPEKEESYANDENERGEDALALTCSALDFEEQNPLMID